MPGEPQHSLHLGWADAELLRCPPDTHASLEGCHDPALVSRDLGLPKRVPLALALANPAFTRSWIIARSNSARVSGSGGLPWLWPASHGQVFDTDGFAAPSFRRLGSTRVDHGALGLEGSARRPTGNGTATVDRGHRLSLPD